MYQVSDHVTESTMPTKSMNLVVLGATGNSGNHVVTQALEQGHRVTALVRSPEKMTITHKNLTIKKCQSVTRREDLTPHFEGHDAVISCLGCPIVRFHPQFIKETFLQDSMRAIAPAMRMANVNRLVVMSSWYLDTKSKDIPAYLRWYLIPFVFGHLIDDHCEMEKYMERECPDINYTMVRLPALLDDPVSDKPIKVVDDGAEYVPDTTFISRADTARFMLSCLGTRKWDGKCPAIATH